MDDLAMYKRRLAALKILRDRYIDQEDAPEHSVYIMNTFIQVMEGDTDFWVNQLLMHDSLE